MYIIRGKFGFQRAKLVLESLGLTCTANVRFKLRIFLNRKWAGGAIFQIHIVIQIFEALNWTTKKYFLANQKQEIFKCYWN